MIYNTAFLAKYEQFCESLVLEPELFRIKTFEEDLKNDLNPSYELDDLFFNRDNWLSFHDFYKYYFAKHKDSILHRYGFNSYDEFSEGLKARLYRTQFGFLTEYHAFFLAKTIFGDNSVSRSVQMDRAGVDFQIDINSIRFNIHIFVDTERSWSYRIFKSKNKYVDSMPGIHVNLPYSLKSGRFNSLRYLKNRFGVYTVRYLDYFKNEVLKGNIKDNNIVGTSPNGFIYR